MTKENSLKLLNLHFLSQLISDPKRINWTDAAMIQSQLKRKAKRLRAVTQTCCLKRNATTALTLPGYIPELVPEVNIKSLSIGANVVVLKASSEDHSEFLSHSHPYEYVRFNWSLYFIV